MVEFGEVTWDRWATLIFSFVAATAAAATAGVNFSRHRREKAQANGEEMRRWSLELSSESVDNWFPAELKRIVGGGLAVRVATIKIEKPRCSLLAPEERIRMAGLLPYSGTSVRSPNVSQSARKLRLEKNLSEATRFDHSGSLNRVGEGHSIERFYVSAPPAGLFSRWHSSRRVTIIVDAEEISSARRSIRIKVHSQPIDWTARSPKATI